MILERTALIPVALVAATAVTALANPLPVLSCGWEDPDVTVLGPLFD